MILFVLAAMNMAMAAPLPPGAAACRLTEAERAAMLAADYDALDQAMEGAASWRAVTARGCYETAADLIDGYAARNRARLTDERQRVLSFHVGQVLAFGGKEAQATSHFEAARGGDAEWDAYVESQLAFVRRDRKAFEAARAAYVRVAPGSMRRGFLGSQSACFDKPFVEALMCQPTAH